MNDWHEAEELIDQALESFRRGQLDDAERSLRKAIALSPDRGDWIFNLALTLEAAGRDDEALKSYLEAAEALPDEPEIIMHAGIALNKAQRPADALPILERACLLNPVTEEVWAHRIDAHARLGNHEEAEHVYFLAQQYLDEFPNCLFAMGESLFDQGEMERAAWCYREAAKQDPSLPRVRARLGAVLAATGRAHQAARMYLQDLRENPGSLDSLMEFGDLLAQLGRLQEAEEKYRRVLELQPADLDAHLRLGALALRMGRANQAVTEFELVRSLDPEFPAARLHLAGALLAARRTLDARRLLLEHTQAVNTSETQAQTAEEAAQLADLLLAASLPGIANDLLVNALESFPNDVSLLRRLSYARFDGGDQRGGDRIARQLLRIDRSLTSVHENLVLSAMDLGRIDLAALRLRRALSEHPADERLRRLRILILMQQIPGLSGIIRRPRAVWSFDTY